MLASGRDVARLSVPFTEPTMTVRLARAHSELLGQGKGLQVRVEAVVSASARRPRGDVTVQAQRPAVDASFPALARAVPIRR